MKKTKRSLFTSIVTLLLCSAMFVGSTFAWFTDTVSNTGNKIQAGTLKIGLEQFKKTTAHPEGEWVDLEEEPEPIFNYGLWEPGYSDVALLKVTNEGNLALKYVLNIKQGEGSALEVNENGHTLADAIWVYSNVGETTIPTAIPAEENIDNTDPAAWHKTLLKDALAETDSAVHGVLLPEGKTARADHQEEVTKEVTMAVILHMDENAGNEYQGLSLGTSFDIELRATQYTYEEDGFNSDQYDLIADGRPDHPEFDEPSVQPTIKKLIVPTDPDNPLIVREPETGESLTVTEKDMSVTYTPGTKLTSETKQAEDKKTADAELGFVYESDTSKLGIIIEDTQGVRQWDLDLNVAQDNDYLVKVEKNIGAGASNVQAYHNEKTNKLERLSSADEVPAVLQKSLGAKEAFFYNETTGVVTLWVFHSSPVEFIYDLVGIKLDASNLSMKSSGPNDDVVHQMLVTLISNNHTFSSDEIKQLCDSHELEFSTESGEQNIFMYGMYGLITAISKGEDTLIATYHKDGKTFTATCNIKVDGGFEWICKIGTTKYQSLSEAFNAAQENDKIVMLKNYDFTGGNYVEKSVTLDLAGHKVLPSGFAYIIVKDKPFVIEDTSTDHSGMINGLSLSSTDSANVTFNNIHMDVNGNIFVQNSTAKANVTLTYNNCVFDVKGSYAGLYQNTDNNSKEATLNFNNTIVKLNGENSNIVLITSINNGGNTNVKINLNSGELISNVGKAVLYYSDTTGKLNLGINKKTAFTSNLDLSVKDNAITNVNGKTCEYIYSTN